MSEFMFLYLGGDPEWMEKTSKEDFAATMARWGEWMAKLQANDQLVTGGSPLNFAGKRVTADGVITDIAASELKELVSGYSIVKAKDYAEAIELAKACPIMENPNHIVEVREIPEMG